MVRKIELTALGNDEGAVRVVEFEEGKVVKDLRAQISEASGIPPAKVKLVAQKGRGTFATLEDREKVPKAVKVGGVPNLSAVGVSSGPSDGEVLDPKAAPVGATMPAPELATPEKTAEPTQPKAAPQSASQPSPTLTRAQALSLQKDFLEHYKSEAFQKKKKAVAEMTDQTKQIAAYREILLEVQKQVLPNYGIEGSQKGAQQMMAAFIPWNEDGEVVAMTNAINKLIDIGFLGTQTVPTPTPSVPQSNQTPEPAAANKGPRKITVAVVGKETQRRTMLVDNDCTVGDLRKILSEAVDEKMYNIKLLKIDRGGTLSSLSDTIKVPPTVTVKGPDRLIQGAEPDGVLLSRTQAIALSEECLAEYQTDTFQAKLKEFEGLSSVAERSKKLREIVTTVQLKIIPKYGFEGNARGIDDLTRAFFVFPPSDQGINKINSEISNLLTFKTEPRKQAAPAQVEEAPAAKEQQVEEAPTAPAKVAAPNARKIKISLQSKPEAVRTLLLEGAQTGTQLKEVLADITGDSVSNLKLIGKTSGQGSFMTLLDKAKVPSAVTVRGAERIIQGGLNTGVILSRPQAIKLIGELEQHYTTETFTSALRELDGLDVRERAAKLRDLVFVEQAQVLPKFGFEASQDGVLAMRYALQVFPAGDEVTEKVTEIGKLLGTMQFYKQEMKESKQHADVADGLVASAQESAAREAVTETPAVERLDTDNAGAEGTVDVEKAAAEEDSAATEKAVAAATGAAAMAAKGAAPTPSDGLRKVELLFEIHDRDARRAISVAPGATVGKLRSLLAEACDARRSEVKVLTPTSAMLKDATTTPATCRVKGPKALVQGGPNSGVLLTRDQAIGLQQELYELFSDVQFKDSFAALDKVLEGKPSSFREDKVRDIVSILQWAVLPKYGFDASHDGVADMVNAIQVFVVADDEQIVSMKSAIDDLVTLKSSSGPDAAPTPPAASAPAKASPAASAPAKAPSPSSAPAKAPSPAGAAAPAPVPAAPAPAPAPEPADTPPPVPTPSVAAKKVPDYVSKADAQTFDPTDDRPRWIVVGGHDRGILVRKGKSTGSADIGRLGHGAVVREQDISYDRLHYEKVSGDGPDFGWVSISSKGSELCRKL